MPDVVDVSRAARELGVDESRVRALIADGLLDAEKLGGRWLVRWDSVVARRRQPTAPGRPMSAQNAWALLIEASGDDVAVDIDPHARWRIRQTLAQHGLAALRGRVSQRARVHHLWGLHGELRPLITSEILVLTGSSAAGTLQLDLAAPDTVDAYLAADDLAGILHEHSLETVPASRANVTLRVVPQKAWFLAGRRIAPAAAVGFDLAAYLDSRSARVGDELLTRLDSERMAR
jgi:hypothetical protein